MEISERAQLAADLKQMYNCCQAVMLALKDDVKQSSDELISLGAGFGLGLGNMEGTCGALVGAVIIAGLRGVSSRDKSREMNVRFRELCGAITCKDIKGVYSGKVLCSCPDCCKNAVIAYEEIYK